MYQKLQIKIFIEQHFNAIQIQEIKTIKKAIAYLTNFFKQNALKPTCIH